MVPTLPQGAGDPDLMVTAPAVSAGGPEAGAQFMLSATVSNDGEGAAAATMLRYYRLRYYRSTDATITTTDTEVGTDAIGELAASGSSSQSVDLTAPSSPGTHFYGACVDAVTDESDTTNNCSTSVPVTVPEPEQRAPSVEIGAADDKEWAPARETVDLTVRVLDDQGEEIAGATVSWSSSNTNVATGTASVTATLPTTVREPEEPERPDMRPDMLVGTIGAPTGIPVGASFDLLVTVRNDGDGESPATTLRYYRSTDAKITMSDTAVGTDDVGVLSASGTSAESISLTAPASPGTYYYGACVERSVRVLSDRLRTGGWRLQYHGEQNGRGQGLHIHRYGYGRALVGHPSGPLPPSPPSRTTPELADCPSRQEPPDVGNRASFRTPHSYRAPPSRGPSQSKRGNSRIDSRCGNSNSTPPKGLNSSWIAVPKPFAGTSSCPTASRRINRTSS